MVTLEKFRELALTFSDTNEQPHFEKTSFRVEKKIFATYDTRKDQASLKLTETDQSVFSAFDISNIYPAPNTWGKQGWTIFNLDKVRMDLFTDALTLAYQNIHKK